MKVNTRLALLAAMAFASQRLPASAMDVMNPPNFRPPPRPAVKLNRKQRRAQAARNR